MVRKADLGIFCLVLFPREGSPDFYISRGSPSEARGASHDIYWSETQGSEADLERRKHMSCANSSLWSLWRLKES